MFAAVRGQAQLSGEGVEQWSDVERPRSLCDQAIEANPKPAADFRAGHAAHLTSSGPGDEIVEGESEPSGGGGNPGEEVESLREVEMSGDCCAPCCGFFGRHAVGAKCGRDSAASRENDRNVLQISYENPCRSR